MIARIPWTTDPKRICEAVNALIDGRFLVTLQRQDDGPLRTRLMGIHTHGNVSYLLIVRPPGLDKAYQVRDLLFKLAGLPVLGFSCPITRESDTLLATMLPYALFRLELRQSGPRLSPSPEAVAKFFLKRRAKMLVCTLSDIGLGGARLSGPAAREIKPHELIGPCTLTLTGKEAVVRREVTINSSIVTRVEMQGGQPGLGLKFSSSEDEARQLAEHLAFLRQPGRS